MAETQKHILFIEDHADTRELVRLIFESLDCRITTSSSCAEGFELAQQHQFDLYMLDSWLPDGSGLELCKKLRQFDPGTPILFLSAAAFEIDKQMAMSSGAQRYLVKPMDIDVLGSETIALINSDSKRQMTMGADTQALALSAA